VALDMPFVFRAEALAAEDGIASGRRLNELTGGAVTRVTQAKRLATWLHSQLPDAAMRDILTVGDPAEDDDDVRDDNGDDDTGPDFSLRRERVEPLIAMLDVKRANGGLSAAEAKAHEAATIRLFGAGASPKKFARLAAQEVDGVLRGQYRFAGAGQTGRMTRRGAQIQNLSRDVLGEDGAAEARLVDMIADGCSYAELAAAEPAEVPVARKLALLVRPAIIAGPKKLFVWSDWSAIEARVTPWLANSPDAERVLDIFRANDRDPSLPDIYTIAAAGILHKAPSEVAKTERQTGKVAVLACIAEGELVLTDVGLVPIEDVTVAMRVWDGVAWVTHSGVVYKGIKDVFTYDGLTATGDHIVYTTQGALQFSDAAARGARLIQSGTGRTPLRVGGNYLSRTALCHRLAPPSRRNPMCRVRHRSLDPLAQPHMRTLERLPTMFTAPANTAVARSYSGSREEPLYEQNGQAVDELRRARHRISFPLSAGSRPLDAGEPWRAPLAAAPVGSDQQQRPLRTGESTLGDAPAADVQHTMLHRRRMGLPRRRVALCVLYRSAAQASRTDTRGDTGAGGAGCCRETQRLARNCRAARVFDILNAGPRHRFTVSGRLVHNCGFGGGVGALTRMALAYRIHLDPAEARRIVDAWRAANSWAPQFWGAHRDGESFGLWGAAMSAWETPGSITSAGRIVFTYREDYLGGSLFMALPSGRWLTYPRPRWRDVDVLDKDGKPTGEKRHELSFRRAHGRAKLWRGTLAENSTQAVAADILRAAVTRIETNPAYTFLKIRMTCHDEIVCECDENRAEEAKSILRREIDVAGMGRRAPFGR
jgi:DNA polymerase